MPEAEPLLRTRQAALALGVSVSTLKRWVDAGELRASRTVGRHRLIAPSEVQRFARERGLPLPLAQIGSAAGSLRGVGMDALREALTAVLHRGRSGEARALILSAYPAEGDAATLADELIRPTMEQIGRRWAAGTLDVFQEHRASRIVETVLMELIRRVPAPGGPSAPLAIGASAEGDFSTLPGLLAELVLRELGWDVMNLGPNLPLASMARAVRAHRPRLAWLTANHLVAPERFLAEFPTLSRAAREAATSLILGGQACRPALRDQIAPAAFGERMAHLRELARQLAPAPS